MRKLSLSIAFVLIIGVAAIGGAWAANFATGIATAAQTDTAVIEKIAVTCRMVRVCRHTSRGTIACRIERVCRNRW